MHCVKQFVSIIIWGFPQHHYNIIFQECLCILAARCASCNAWHTSSAHLCNPAGGYIRWRIDSHHWYWFATRHLQRWESSHIWYKLFYKGYHLSFLIGIWEYILHFICFYTYLFHRQTSAKKYRSPNTLQISISIRALICFHSWYVYFMLILYTNLQCFTWNI